MFEALREGRCYIASHAVAPARGFRFSADGVEMGAEAPFAGQELQGGASAAGGGAAAAATATEVERRGRRPRCPTAPSGPGVYRVEAYLETYGQRRTWILSNPVYLR